MDTWSTSRKISAFVFAIVAYGLLAGVAMYIAGVLFLMLCKANPAQAGVTSIVGYWRAYEDDARLRSRLRLASGASGLVLLVLVPGAMLSAARPRRSLFGAARFANAAEVRRAGLYGGNGPSILVGRHRGRYLALRGELSVMLSAPTRSGKGVGVVIPNLLNFRDSVVVLDIKGENFAVTAGFRSKHFPVFAFSPFDPDARSHRWNPLSVVQRDTLHVVGDLLSIGNSLFPIDGAGKSETFFNDHARNMFLGLGLLLSETPELPFTMGEMLRQASGKGRPLADHIHGMLSKRTYSDTCVFALRRLLSNSENTLACVVATFNAPLTIFADPVVDAATSGDDFSLTDVRRKRMSIYVRIPTQCLSSAKPLLNLFFSQLVIQNTGTLPSQDATLKYQCLIIADEFPSLGRVDAIVSASAFLAGYNLRLLTVVQAMSQLDAVYGEHQARTFATNHGLQILFAPREQRDAEEYSAALGYTTVTGTSRGRSRSLSGPARDVLSSNESDQRRALLLPQEFKDLGSEKLVLIPEHCKPVLGGKICYYKDKAFKDRLLPPPEVPRMDMKFHRAQVHESMCFSSNQPPTGDAGAARDILNEGPDVLRDSSERLTRSLMDHFRPHEGRAGEDDPSSHA
jgi:type IV secretion system protein VirD4